MLSEASRHASISKRIQRYATLAMPADFYVEQVQRQFRLAAIKPTLPVSRIS